MLSVRKFLNCASLECFGIVYGWYGLAVTIIVGTISCSKTAYYIPEDSKYASTAVAKKSNFIQFQCESDSLF